MSFQLIISCRHDLDNIVLEKLKDERTMSAVYELEALVVTGKPLTSKAIHVAYPALVFLSPFAHTRTESMDVCILIHLSEWHTFFSCCLDELNLWKIII